MSVKMQDLTPKAAIKDAQDIFKNITLYIIRINDIFIPEIGDKYILTFYDIITHAMIVRSIEEGFTNDIEQHKMDIFRYIRNDIEYNGVLVKNFQNLYSYAKGEEADEDAADKFINRILQGLFSSLISIHKGETTYSFNALNQTFPRIAKAVHLCKLRLEIKYMLERNDKKNEEQYISPQMLADLADVTIKIIRKNIHNGNLDAKKINNNWKIPLDTALDWLKNR